MATYLFIVIPMMRPVFITSLVLVAAGIVRTYDLVVAMTGGGPGLSVAVLPAIYVYEYMFASNLGAGARRVLEHDAAAVVDHRRARGRSSNSAAGGLEGERPMP